MGALAAAQGCWRRLRDVTARYLANDDPLAAAANKGAFLVWSSQPLYPLYVALLVGRDAWPALLTWLSTPVFFAVPFIARQSSQSGRAAFIIAGVANTLLSAKALGTGTDVGWFLIPCFVIAAGFFRGREWPAAIALGTLIGLAGLALPHLGAPLHVYSAAQSTSLSHLNLGSVVGLSLYLGVVAAGARWRKPEPPPA